MLEILEFVFASWGHFLGTVILILAMAFAVSLIPPLIRVNIIKGED